jgi:hypothetical protein
MTERREQEGMHKRRITLADGRYLIFYTFDDLPAPPPGTQSADEGASKSSQPEPEAEEERRV